MQCPELPNRLIIAGAIATLALTGCAYRLSPPAPPSQHTLRIVAKAPELYTIYIQTKPYPVPADGKVAFNYGAMQSGCNVYLFDRILIKRAPDPFKGKGIALTIGGKTVKTFSLQEISHLPVDSAGNLELQVRNSP